MLLKYLSGQMACFNFTIMSSRRLSENYVCSLLTASSRYGPYVPNTLPAEIVSMSVRNGRYTCDMRCEKAHFGHIGILSPA